MAEIVHKLPEDPNGFWKIEFRTEGSNVIIDYFFDEDEEPSGSVTFEKVCNYFFSYIEAIPKIVNDSVGNIVRVENSIVFQKELIEYIGLDRKIYCANFDTAGYVEVIAKSFSVTER